MFNWIFYLDLYPELKLLGVNNNITAYNHWIFYGKSQSRIPYHVDEKLFDYAYYISHNKQLKGYTHKQAIIHWYTIGKACKYACFNKQIVIPQLKVIPQPVLINILTRTSDRPVYFALNRRSVLQQTYPHIRHIISADTYSTFNYLTDIYPRDKIFVKCAKRTSSAHMPYNLYCNELMNRVESGWILFLDDDDLLMDPNSIQILVNFIQNDDNLLLWRVKFPDKIIPEYSFGIKPTYKDIASNGFMFNAKYKNQIKWDDMTGSDYRVVNSVFNIIDIKPIWIDIVLTKINYSSGTGGKGEKNDKLMNISQQISSSSTDIQPYRHKNRYNDILYDYFDHVYIINLDYDYVKWNNIVNILSKQQIYFYTLFYKVYHNNDKISYLLTIKNLLINAIHYNYNKILLLYTDIVFHKDFANLISTHSDILNSMYGCVQFCNTGNNNIVAIHQHLYKSILTNIETVLVGGNFTANIFPKNNIILGDNLIIHSPINNIIYNTTPLVSVIITTFNSEKYVKYAIESILKQTYTHLEIIIVDDCSSDTTMDILGIIAKTDNRIFIVKNDYNYGTYISKNIGIKHSHGQYITFHDSDDYSVSTRIYTQINILLQNSSYKASICMFNSRLNMQKIAEITLCIDRCILYTIGYFDSVRVGADSEYRKRIMLAGFDIAIIKQYMYCCLDRLMEFNGIGKSTSLTAATTILGKNSEARNSYKTAFKNYYNSLKKPISRDQLYIAFPLKTRLYNIQYSGISMSNLFQPTLSANTIYTYTVKL